MSQTPNQEAAAKAPATTRRPEEVRVYGHSMIFYYWPVWVLGYVFGFWTLWQDQVLAIVPAGSQYVAEQSGKKHYILIPTDKEYRGERDPHIKISPNKNLGVIYCIVTLVVIFATSVTLRGLRSLVLMISVLLLTVLFAWLGWWEQIFEWFGRLSLHMNAGFYLFFSTVLFVLWLLTTFVYDRMHYWRITPGEITHRFLFAGGEVSYDTEGMAFEKMQDDLFRHWILGLGSGDLVMHPLKIGTIEQRELQVQNVLRIGNKLGRIQELIARKPE
ncbi:MAG: hypothetical protein C4297_13550 [Gemmataceae bacterium]